MLTLLLASAIDLTLGDPPTSLHPVGWIGKSISLLETLAPQKHAWAQFLYGAMIVILVMALFAVPAYFLLSYLREVNSVLYIVIGGLLLKSTFSIKGLGRSARQMKRLLEENDLDKARTEIRCMVSRDADELDESLLVAATVESVAENSSDSFVSPLFYFLILGVPGAMAYRVVNTFDSMIGYRGEYEYLGKFAARLDDVLNFIPARLTGMMIVLAAAMSRRRSLAAWRIMLRDHANVSSPNAGWPMSAAAGALGVCLEKVRHYKLGDAVEPPSADTIGSAVILMYLVAVVWFLLCFGTLGVLFVITS